MRYKFKNKIKANGKFWLIPLFVLCFTVLLFLPISFKPNTAIMESTPVNDNPFDLPEVKPASVTLSNDAYQYASLGSYDTDEYDYYASSSYYHLTWIQPTSTLDNFQIDLYSDSGYTTLLESSTIAGDGLTDFIVWKPTSSSTYYIEAESSADSGYYYLEAEYASSALSIGSRATISNLGSSDSGEIYYSYLTSGTAYTVILDVPSTADYDLYVFTDVAGDYKDRNEYAHYSNSGTGYNQEVTITPTSSQNYIFVIVRQSGSGSAYFRVEDNNKLVSETAETGYLSTSGDTDEYFYHIYDTGTASSDYHVGWVRSYYSSDDFDINLYTYNTYVTKQEYASQSGAYVDFVVMKASTPTTYYLEAESYSGTGDYYIEAEETSSVTVGSSSSTSVALTTTTELVEAYTVSLTASTLYTLELDVSSSQDYDMYVYYISSSGTKTYSEYVATSNTATGTDIALSYTPTYTGYYAIVITQYAGSGTAYLKVSTGSGSTSSTSLTSGTYKYDQLTSSSDNDYYSFYCSSSSYSVVWAYPTSSSDNFNLYAYTSSSYSSSTESSTATGDSVDAIIVKPSSSATYYFKYSPYTGTGYYYLMAETAVSISEGTQKSVYLSSTDAVDFYYMYLSSSYTYSTELTVDSGDDFDIYLYSLSSTTKGISEYAAYSASSSSGADESFTYSPSTSGYYGFLVVRDEGSGYGYLTVSQGSGSSGTGSSIDFVSDVLPWLLGVVGVIVFIGIVKAASTSSTKSGAKKVLERGRNMVMTEDYNGALQILEPQLPKLRKAKLKEAGEVEALIKNVKLHQGVASAFTRYQQQHRSGDAKGALDGLKQLSAHANRNKANLNPQLVNRVNQEMQQIGSSMDQSANVIRQTLGQVTQYMEAQDYDQAVQFLSGKKAESQKAGLVALSKEIDDRIQNITRFKKLFNLFKISSKVKLDDASIFNGMAKYP
jgi:hypothetical protein